MSKNDSIHDSIVETIKNYTWINRAPDLPDTISGAESAARQIVHALEHGFLLIPRSDLPAVSESGSLTNYMADHRQFPGDPASRADHYRGEAYGKLALAEFHDAKAVREEATAIALENAIKSEIQTDGVFDVAEISRRLARRGWWR